MQYHELRGKLGLEPFEPRDTPPLVNFMPNWEISNRLLFAEVIALADEWIWDWRNLAKRMGMRGARLAGDCQHPHTLYVQTTSKSSRKRHGLSAVGSLPLEPQPLLALVLALELGCACPSPCPWPKDHTNPHHYHLVDPHQGHHHHQLQRHVHGSQYEFRYLLFHQLLRTSNGKGSSPKMLLGVWERLCTIAANKKSFEMKMPQHIISQ